MAVGQHTIDEHMMCSGTTYSVYTYIKFYLHDVLWHNSYTYIRFYLHSLPHMHAPGTRALMAMYDSSRRDCFPSAPLLQCTCPASQDCINNLGMGESECSSAGCPALCEC